MKWKFKEEHSLESRKQESATVRKKHPDRIPVIVGKTSYSRLPSIDKQKFLVPGDITLVQFIWIIRKRVLLGPDKAMFVFVNKKLTRTSASMSEIYDENMDEDGFLYIAYGEENTFGCDKLSAITLCVHS